jgi:hypothetical protein
MPFTLKQLEPYIKSVREFKKEIDTKCEFYAEPEEEQIMFESLADLLNTELTLEQIYNNYKDSQIEWTIVRRALESLEEYEYCAKVKFLQEKEADELYRYMVFSEELTREEFDEIVSPLLITIEESI